VVASIALGLTIHRGFAVKLTANLLLFPPVEIESAKLPFTFHRFCGMIPVLYLLSNLMPYSMNEDKQYLTKEKFQEFTTELEYLRSEKRKEVAEHLEYAKKLGDLSENAEYQEAREEQAEVEDRINHLESVMKHAIIMDGAHSDIVGMGSVVKVQKDGESDVRTYKIVGSEEADMIAGKVSNMSPMGSALMGKKKGDKFSFKTPKGEMKYALVKVE
jgi:transcription elongation factor GreA